MTDTISRPTRLGIRRLAGHIVECPLHFAQAKCSARS